MNEKLGARKWLTFIIAGLVGQLAWAIENMYLNVYAFYVSSDYLFIPLMTALSAVTATVTTLLMGALSDRLGKRKAFISFGYIIWGVSIILFAFFDPHKEYSFIGNSAMLAGTFIVILDCIMTFFGSTANDASFNAYVTDNTNTKNRGKVESFLSILPMVAMIMIVVAAGFLVSRGEGQEPLWLIFFLIFGALTLIAGVVLLFIIPKDELTPNKEEKYIKNIFYGFRPSVIKQNKMLYFILIAFTLFNMAIQCFFPYFMVYVQNVLMIQGGDFTITLGVVLVLGCLITVGVGLFMDKIGKNRVLIPAIGVAIAGAIAMFFSNTNVLVMISGTVLMAGYLVGTAVFGAKIRDNTPKEEAGLFQGIRMIFAVMIPMVTGPYIGEALFHINEHTYINEYGKTVLEPNAFMFVGVAVLMALTLGASIFIILKEKKNGEEA